jgi:hypothetical protein
MMQKSASSYWLGAPIIDMDRRAFERTVMRRFEMTTGGAQAYVDRIAERQMAKAGSLLPYNAILFAILSFSDAKTALPRLTLLGGLAAVASCLFLLAVLHTSWGQAADYADPQIEFRHACQDCYRRAYLLSAGLALSVVATAMAVGPLLRQLAP